MTGGTPISGNLHISPNFIAVFLWRPHYVCKVEPWSFLQKSTTFFGLGDIAGQWWTLFISPDNDIISYNVCMVLHGQDILLQRWVGRQIVACWWRNATPCDAPDNQQTQAVLKLNVSFPFLILCHTLSSPSFGFASVNPVNPSIHSHSRPREQRRWKREPLVSGTAEWCRGWKSPSFGRYYGRHIDI